MSERDNIIFNKNTVEFVTVAAEYCAYLEQCAGKMRAEFIDTLLKLLPLLYLKASMLPDEEAQSDETLQDFVTEGDYEAIRTTIVDIMGEKDDYLEVFLNDMKYSDTPILKNISEDLSDIYQDNKNFVSQFKTGLHPIMNDAVIQCHENFAHYWGQTLVNTLRALHDVKYNTTDFEEENKVVEQEDF